MLKVYELFYSIQGEGPFAGRPAVFLRLSGCIKPYCSFCDTKEALEEGYFIETKELFKKILSFNSNFIVITGGEPFLQWNQGLKELEELLLEAEIKVQYESSGRAGIPADTRGLIVLSPKPGQWPDKKTLERAFAVKPLLGSDSQEVLEEIKKSGLKAEKIWLMALGADREEQLRRMPELWDICSKNSYNLCARLHILSFDKKKGV